MDTLAIAENLEASGFERKQAKAVANAVRQGQGDLVTKADLKADLALMESRLTDKLSSQQRWYVGLLFVAAGLTVTAIKLI